MTEKEKLYETLGELLYVVAKVDGVIQEEEKEKLEKLFKYHAWASEIKWSFYYELKKDSSIEETYQKVISFCHAYGPAPEYNEFIDAMKDIAEAATGIDGNEENKIASFSTDLIARFQKDMDKAMR